MEARSGSANGNRTRILALKGLRANRCTIAPQRCRCFHLTRFGWNPRKLQPVGEKQHLDGTAAFGAPLDPTEAGQDPADDRHSCPENPMLFEIACKAKLKVSCEKMDFRAYVEQTEYDQEQDE
jgi:hypothetical protein